MPEDDIAYFPEKYEENYLYLLEVDPTHLHVFWEIPPENIPDHILKESLNNLDLCLKIFYETQDSPYKSTILSSDEFHVQGLMNDWFIPLERPLTQCHAELGYRDPEDGSFISLCRSNPLDFSLASKIEPRSISPVQQEEKNKEGPFSDTHKEMRGTDFFEHITEDDVKDYYRSLSDRVVSNPKFTPWRSLLEIIFSEEVKRTLHLSGHPEFYLPYLSPSDTHSSYLSTISSYSSNCKIDKDTGE